MSDVESKFKQIILSKYGTYLKITITKRSLEVSNLYRLQLILILLRLYHRTRISTNGSEVTAVVWLHLYYMAGCQVSGRC